MYKISRAMLLLVMIFIGCAHVNSSQNFSNSKDSVTESAGVKEFVSPPIRMQMKELSSSVWNRN